MQKFENVRNIYINGKNTHAAIGGSMIMIIKHGFLTASYFVKVGIKKVRQFIKSGIQVPAANFIYTNDAVKTMNINFKYGR